MFQESESIKVALYSALKIDFPVDDNLNIASTTDTSVEVVSSPQKADQSLATIPLATTSEPLLTVPAHKGTYKIVLNSSNSATLHMGCTRPPLLVKQE